MGGVWQSITIDDKGGRGVQKHPKKYDIISERSLTQTVWDLLIPLFSSLDCVAVKLNWFVSFEAKELNLSFICFTFTLF